MGFQSLFPPVPDLPFTNVHNLFLNRPDQAGWKDYTLHVDAVTGNTRKWSEFKDRVARGATALGDPARFLHEGNAVIGILSENRLEYIALVHSLLAAGIPFALFPASSTSYELKHLVKVSKVRKVFTSLENFENARIIAKEAGFSESDAIFILGGKLEGNRSFDDLVRSVKEPAKDYTKPVSKDALAYLLFSSGTTGPPKGVMVSYKEIMFSVMQGSIIATLNAAVASPPRYADIPVTLGSLPFYHRYGFNAFCFRAFAVPCTTIITPRRDVSYALKLIPKYASRLQIPSVTNTIIKMEDWAGTDTSSVETVGSGAAFLPPELCERFQSKLKSTFFHGYGSSEVVRVRPLFSRGSGGIRTDLGHKPVYESLGLLMPGLQARIIREDGSEGGVGEPGELWVKGGSDSQGYFDDEPGTSKTFTKDGWLKTGDIFIVDERGNYHFVERVKDTLKVSGVQVSPSELETALMTQPDDLIIDIVVAGVSGGRMPDEKVPRAWVVLSQAGKRKGAAATIKILEDWSRQNLTKRGWLRGGFEIVIEIPKSPTGKVLRRALQDAYEQKQGIAVTGKPKF